ncbi:shikimate dehydrogenase [bacterium]|jgi:shikimate dehydrogenase|nr:shikimate dehydrogenase [bacterium]
MLNGSTKILGVIGNPIHHSKSPQMHNAALTHLNLNYIYIPFLVEKNHIKTCIASLKSNNISGINVTIPFKEDVIPFLDKLDPLAKKIGAVNTIVNNNGSLTGYNTDGYGLISDLNINNISLSNKSIVVLGAGGSSKSICFSLIEQNIKSLLILNRTVEKADTLKSDLINSLTNKATIPIETNSLTSVINETSLKSYDIIINTTSVGLNDNSTVFLTPMWSNPNQVVYDIIYSPPETNFLKQARLRGSKTLNGLGMLVGQGARAFKIFTSHDAPFDIMYNEVKKC